MNLPDGCTDAQIDRHFSQEDERVCGYCEHFIPSPMSYNGVCSLRYGPKMSAQDVADVCVVGFDGYCDDWKEY